MPVTTPGSAPSSPKGAAHFELLVEYFKSHFGTVWAGRATEGVHSGSLLAVRPIALRFPVTAKSAEVLASAAKAWVGVSFPGVVPILEVHERQGELVVASAMVDAVPLSELLRTLPGRKGALDPGIVVRILGDLLVGLGHLHASGRYQPGGLTAEAILVAADGVSWIFEAGIAAAVGGVGAWAGHRDRASYAAPESLSDDRDDLSATPTAGAKADLFTLGVLAWELLRREKLFTGLGHKALAESIRHGPIARLDVPRPRDGSHPAPVSRALADVIARALEREPARRFESAAAMASALARSGVTPASHDTVASLAAELTGSLQRARRVREVTGDHPVIAPAQEAARQQQGQAPAGPPGKPPQSAPGRRPPAPHHRLPPPRTRPTSSMALVGAVSRPPPAAGAPSTAVAGSPRPVAPATPQSDAPRPEPEDDASEAPTMVPGPIESRGPAASARVDSDAPPPPSLPPPSLSLGSQRQIGRCELFTEIAHGGMATIHLGRWIGAGGFAKTVAVKALHRQYARDPEFVKMFLDEARVVARIRHPNVMPTIDLVDEAGELFIVMDYVQGVTLAHLLRSLRRLKKRVPLPIVLRVMSGVLHGLHAAHEAKTARGEPMCVIHRDVSPDNVLIGIDGYARLIDFGIASAMGRYTATRDGQVKGKIAYLTPEQVLGDTLDRRSDIFSTSVVLWQTLTGKKLFSARTIAEVTHRILSQEIRPPSAVESELPAGLDAIVLKGLERTPSRRWDTAEEMAEALERLGGLASHREVGRWVTEIAGERLERSAQLLNLVETAPVDVRVEDLSGPLTIQRASTTSVPPALRLPMASRTEDVSQSQLSLTDLNSENAPRRSAAVRARVRWPIALAVTALAALAAGAFVVLRSAETTPDGGSSGAASSRAPSETAPETRASADRSPHASAGRTVPSASASGGGSTPPAVPPSASASTSSGPVRPPPAGPWPPTPRPRLPTDI